MTTQEGVRLMALLYKWRAFVEANDAPTDKIIGVAQCADELDALLRKFGTGVGVRSPADTETKKSSGVGGLSDQETPELGQGDV